MIDIIEKTFGETSPKIDCLDHGFVRLVDCMPRVVEGDDTCDQAITRAARVSYGKGTKTVRDDETLIRHLMRHVHTSCFEVVKFSFHMKLPIFLARQFVRHRTANISEYSQRYSEPISDCYLPDTMRLQSNVNKQGSSDDEVADDLNMYLRGLIGQSYGSSFDVNEMLATHDTSRELSRMVLPVGAYTEWYFTMDLKNLLHFLSLRCDEHAQLEAQVYGEAMLKLIEKLVPATVQAWNDYHPLRGAMTLSKLEVNALKQMLNDPYKDPDLMTDNKRENDEWITKYKKLL